MEERDYDTVWTAGLLRTAAVGLVVFFAAGPIATAYGEPRVEPLLQAIKLVQLDRRMSYRRLTTLGIAEAATEALLSVALAPALGVGHRRRRSDRQRP